MMGRLQTWIDRLGRSRRRKGAVGLPARRRSLRFELCESRLALSAATSAGAPLDGDTITYAELMADLWASTPGTARWVQVTFGAGVENVATNAAVRMEYTIDREAPPLRDLQEGGLITFDSFAAIGQTQFTLTRDWNAAVDTIVTRLDVQGRLDGVGAIQLNAGFDRDASATLGAGPLIANPIGSGALNLGAIDSGEIGSAAPILPSAIDSPSSWEFEPTDSPDLLGETEATSPVGDGGALNTTPPILRITAPLDPARNEGGRIDLTAMAGPTSLDRQASFEALSVQAATRRTATRAGAGLPAAASSESLRARAVVYEVAYQRDDKRSEATDELDASLGDAAQHDHEANASTPSQSATQSTNRESAASASSTTANVRRAAIVDAESAKAATPDANESVRRDAARSRDAALASLGDDYASDGYDSEDGNAEGALALTDARHRNVGLAIALAVTAAPLARRYRRSKQAHAAERNSGLS
jgi:hypothetical protein